MLTKRATAFALAALAASALAFHTFNSAGAEEGVPAAAPAAASTGESTDTAAPATKTKSPVMTMMYWVAGQVVPGESCKCPSTEEGATAWRAWFSGGSDVPLAGLRDAMVADGWNADRTIAWFEAQSKKGCSKGDCSKGDCTKKEPATTSAASGETVKTDAKAGDATEQDGGCCKDKPCCKPGSSEGKPCCEGKGGEECTKGAGEGCRCKKPEQTETAPKS
jgi:hypothetical protein